jgi:hypothetical protein
MSSKGSKYSKRVRRGKEEVEEEIEAEIPILEYSS